nr:sodium:proton antiporter NhaD [Magnetofaba australis]
MSLFGVVALAGGAWASASPEITETQLDLTHTATGYLAVMLFVVAYLVVMGEEVIKLRKSKPVLLAAGLIWGMIAFAYSQHGLPHVAEAAMRHNILEYAELFLFLLVAMTYVNAMEERLVFQALRSWLVRSGFNYRMMFWMTGILAFFISPVADNLTTALLMCAVLLAVGQESPRFVSLGCVNVVVAANAGGAFSPFGDITTLMVWQKGVVDFWTFFHLFIPSAVTFLLPAAVMHFFVPQGAPAQSDEQVFVKRGGLVIIGLFLATIATAVGFHNFLHLPPVAGMMMGLAYLKFYSFYLRKTFGNQQSRRAIARRLGREVTDEDLGGVVPFDSFNAVARAEWDTLLFFYGVILCVGGLGMIGYLAWISEAMYAGWGPTAANIAVGVLSAVIDNIPIMYAVLTMQPQMDLGQWLLVTLTAGVGGSLLSIGSAAGVALMGQSRGRYTFFTHLRWTPVIALGYAGGIATHFVLNAHFFKP